jgi:hypothetical protein
MFRVDVVVAALWPGEDVGGCLQRVKARSKLPLRVHVLDASHDPSGAKTLSAAWNDLSRAGNAKYVAFVKTDVVLCRGWDRLLTACLEKHPEVGAVVPAFFGRERPVSLVAEGPAAPMPPGEPSVPDLETLTEFAEMFDDVLYHYDECNAPFSVAMVRRETLGRLRGFDERFRLYGHDHDFQRRMLAHTRQLTASLRSCPAYTREGGASVESLIQTKADLGREYEHLKKARTTVLEGSPWQELRGRARARIRRDPSYGRLPVPGVNGHPGEPE